MTDAEIANVVNVRLSGAQTWEDVRHRALRMIDWKNVVVLGKGRWHGTAAIIDDPELRVISLPLSRRECLLISRSFASEEIVVHLDGDLLPLRIERQGLAIDHGDDPESHARNSVAWRGWAERFPTNARDGGRHTSSYWLELRDPQESRLVQPISRDWHGPSISEVVLYASGQRSGDAVLQAIPPRRFYLNDQSRTVFSPRQGGRMLVSRDGQPVGRVPKVITLYNFRLVTDPHDGFAFHITLPASEPEGIGK